MARVRCVVWTCVGSLLAFAACQEPQRPLEPDAAAASPSEDQSAEGATTSIDDWFTLQAKRIPGFAGIYYDNVGVLVLRLGDPTREAEAQVAAKEILGKRYELSTVTRTLKADYDFLALAEWRNRLESTWDKLPEVVSLDVDEIRNRVAIGVTSATSVDRVTDVLATLSIPPEAVAIVEENPSLATSLSDYVRPVGGGLLVNWRRGTEGPFACTLAFNAVYEGEEVFVTAGHCSSVLGDDAVYYQPVQLNSAIGDEYWNPGAFSSSDDWRCPTGTWCRWSDFLVAKYRAGVGHDVGTIMRTTYRDRNHGSTTIAASDPHLFVADSAEIPVGGQMLDKIGKTTGWTYGFVTNTCVDYFVFGEYRLCQYRVSGGVGGGDSGSPVFAYLSGSLSVTLYGVLWGADGGAFLFSALHEILRDLSRSSGYPPYHARSFDRMTYDFPPPPPPAPAVYIDGSRIQPIYETCSYYGSATGGTPPYSYKWLVNGAVKQTSGQWFDWGAPPDFQLKLEVTDAIGSVGSFTINVTSSSSVQECEYPGP